MGFLAHGRDDSGWRSRPPACHLARYRVLHHGPRTESSRGHIPRTKPRADLPTFVNSGGTDRGKVVQLALFELDADAHLTTGDFWAVL